MPALGPADPVASCPEAVVWLFQGHINRVPMNQDGIKRLTHLPFPTSLSTALPSYQTAPPDVDSTNLNLDNHRVKLTEEGVGEKARQGEHVAENLGSVPTTAHHMANDHP